VSIVKNTFRGSRSRFMTLDIFTYFIRVNQRLVFEHTALSFRDFDQVAIARVCPLVCCSLAGSRVVSRGTASHLLHTPALISTLGPVAAAQVLPLG
jgi:hypothetical protein